MSSSYAREVAFCFLQVNLVILLTRAGSGDRTAKSEN